MNNPYFELHKKFRDAGAELLISSGQACVAFGIAAFSKDGDWIIRENLKSCRAVLNVLESQNAQYRLGAPLAPEWLKIGLTSHFEYQREDGTRMRVDFCSRPPRIPDIKTLWQSAIKAEGLDIVGVDSLLRLKQTRRLRDYPVIGALAETAGLGQQVPSIALSYLQDYQLLAKAVRRWPREAAKIDRDAVRMLLTGADRRDVVIALALEQDKLIQEDEKRIRGLQSAGEGFARRFSKLRTKWRKQKTGLFKQHAQLTELAVCLLPGKTAKP